MAKKAPIPTIVLTKTDIDLFETFLQYGDLAKSKLIFIGREEGLAGDYYPGMPAIAKYNLAMNARRLLFTGTKFASNRVFVNETDANDGWYINDSDCLKHAQWNVLNKTSYIKSPIAEPTVIELQARFHGLMKGDNRSSDYGLFKKQNFAICPSLHTLGNAAMIDYFPLPHIDKNDFPYQYFGPGKFKFTNKQEYEIYYDSKTNNRYRILKKIYDTYPMNVSVVYAGEKDRDFRLLTFYKSLGFEFGSPLYTDDVNHRSAGYINPTPSHQKVRFLIGVHKDKEQKVILTPFFSTQHTIQTNDIDVISSWV